MLSALFTTSLQHSGGGQWQSANDDTTGSCGCGCGCEDEEEDVIIAKIVKGADGEDEYVEPTDEEFEAVQKAYDALVEESEQE